MMFDWWPGERTAREIAGLRNDVEFWQHQTRAACDRVEDRYAEEWRRAEAWRKYAEDMREYAKNLQHALNCYKMADGMGKR